MHPRHRNQSNRWHPVVGPQTMAAAESWPI